MNLRRHWLYLLTTILVVFAVGQSLFAQDTTTTQDDDDAAVVVEGLVQAINVNVITIYNIDFRLDDDDPLLTSIQVGSPVHIEADVEQDDDDDYVFIALLTQAVDPAVFVPTIIVNGPVEAININIVTIYNIDIQLAADNPLLASLVVGDTVQVNGAPAQDTSGTLVIVAITIIIIDLPEATQTPESTLETTPEATPEATPNPDDDDAGVIIIIEGPVQSININIITIYNFQIELDDDDPMLLVIQIGDIIRVEGEMLSSGTTIVIVAVTIVIVNVDYVIDDDGSVWRDNNNCNNPPPPWAPAHGWRRRCERGGNGGSGSDS